MIKESKIYTTTDGKEFKTKKSAERYENELLAVSEGLTKQDVDTYIVDIAESNRVVKTLLSVKSDWRDWAYHQVKQLVKMIKDFKDDIVTYKIIDKHWNGEEKVILEIKTKRIENDNPPKEFQDKVDELNNNSVDGTAYELEMLEVAIHQTQPTVIKYKIKEIPLTIEEKLKQGIELSSREIENLVFEYHQVYEEQGENRRWSQSMLTVVEVEGLGFYAISWDRGLTENQDNEFYNQPQKVELRKKEVITTVTEVVYLEDK